MRVCIVGIVGLPAQYGGFETLTENLVGRLAREGVEFHVFCSAAGASDRPREYRGARLWYLPWRANGPQSVIYDGVALRRCRVLDPDVVLVLGVSGGLWLPRVRKFLRGKVIVNIDGVEWRREKWGSAAKAVLRLSESMAVKYADTVIADNGGIADYVKERYEMEPQIIAYGGDHAVLAEERPLEDVAIPQKYALAVCRIEPENNVHVALQAWASMRSEIALVVVGNWQASAYGRRLREAYGGHSRLHLLDPIYDVGILKALRKRCACYIHGHSAGGTNPSLVEAMHFGVPVVAYDCVFNRWTTEEEAAYFSTPRELVEAVGAVRGNLGVKVGREMKRIAQRRFTWDRIAGEYMTLFREMAEVERDRAPLGDEGGGRKRNLGTERKGVPD